MVTDHSQVALGIFWMIVGSFDVSGWMVMDGFGWFWVLANCLDGFK